MKEISGKLLMICSEKVINEYNANPLLKMDCEKPAGFPQPLSSTVGQTRIMSTKKTKWQSYEEVSRYLLNQIAHKFDLSHFEGKQKIGGKRSGTEWEIDAKGVKEGSDIFFIVECRRYTTSRQSQEKIGALAYRIQDTGASGGIIVSPLGIQEGGKKIAQSENIHEVILDANSTTENYIMRFLNDILVGVTDKISIKDSVTVIVYDKDGNIVNEIKGK